MATRCIYAKANSYNPGFNDTPRPIGQPSVMTSGTVHPDRSSFTRSINHPDQHKYVHGYSRKSHADTRLGYHYYDGRPGGGSYFDSYYLDPMIYADSYVYTNPKQNNGCTYPKVQPYGISSSDLFKMCTRTKSTNQDIIKNNVQSTTNSEKLSSDDLKNTYIVKNNNMSDTSYYNLGSCLCTILIIAFVYLIFRRR